MKAEWSKDVFAKNLKYYMERSGKNQKEMAAVVGVSAPTFNEWLKGKKFPRIDKIEKLAQFFGILKSDLIEDKGEEHRTMQQKNSTLADLTVRMRSDSEFASLIEGINQLNPDQLASIKQVVDAFLKG
ncbi:MAG: helix-turn-helix transcriptional regulator [Bacteroidales bacterium]|nr:helix-turn-helix transcriptional regulator [Bacteroidales bacterium]